MAEHPLSKREVVGSNPTKGWVVLQTEMICIIERTFPLRGNKVGKSPGDPVMRNQVRLLPAFLYAERLAARNLNGAANKNQ